MHPTTPQAALPVYTTADVRAIEQAAVASGHAPNLMERAGLAAAEIARERLLEGRKSVLVLAGPGNNGGDGFVLARHLKAWWYRVSVLFVGDRTGLGADAAAAHDEWLAAGGDIASELFEETFDLVVDALFGIGLERDIAGRHAELIEWINRQPAPVLALDIPSGLHADRGRVLGTAVEADHTVTFIALKPGLLTLEGPDHAGEIHVRDLGLAVEALRPAQGHLVGSSVLGSVLPRRRRDSHKGSYGSVGIVGGAPGMAGAGLLAGRAALRLGAGRVYLGILDPHAPGVDLGQPELMLRSAEEVLAIDHLTCLVVGPGLSQSPQARSAVALALERDLPLVLDADALNLIGAHDALQDVCRARHAPTVLTPHPAEAGRLLQAATGQVQADRLAAALRLAADYGAATVLKGAGSVLAFPDGRWRINTTGNPGLASAGMGDVLSGILGALIAQGASSEAALAAGVHLHGAAADAVLAAHGGPIGMTGAEIIDAARALLNRAIYGDGAKPSKS
ncbi:MAG TPA: NAD(P)H-hydrate dehydratase [Burkholderiales bacterium]|nr:NAD(P)H-hydrate dehydratase [Burkholderiales bacterium]